MFYAKPNGIYGLLDPIDYKREIQHKYGIIIRNFGLESNYTTMTEVWSYDLPFSKTWHGCSDTVGYKNLYMGTRKNDQIRKY